MKIEEAQRLLKIPFTKMKYRTFNGVVVEACISTHPQRRDVSTGTVRGIFEVEGTSDEGGLLDAFWATFKLEDLDLVDGVVVVKEGCNAMVKTR